MLAVAQLAAGLHEVCRQALFARLDVRGPRIAALLAFGTTLATGLVVLLAQAGNERLIGLGAAVLASDIAAVTTVIVLLRKEIRPEPIADRRRLGAAALASTVMLPLAALGWVLLEFLHGNRAVDLLIVSMTSALALGLFGLTLRATIGPPRTAR